MAVRTKELNKRIENLRRMGVPEQQIQRAVREMQAEGEVDERTGVERVVSGLIKPAVDYGALVGEAGYQLAGTGNRRELNKLTKKMEQGQATEEELNRIQELSGKLSGPSPFAQNEDLAEFEQGLTGKSAGERILRGTGYGTKKGAAAASYFVPAGKTLGTAALYGAAGGGMRALGETTGENALDTLVTTGAGAVGGAGAGAAFYGAGKAFNALRGKGGKLKQPVDVTGRALDEDPFFESSREELQKVADDIGLDRTQNTRKQVKVLKEGFEEAKNQVDDMLKGADPIEESTLLDDFINRLDDTEFEDATPSNKRFLNNLLKRLSGANGNPEDLNNLKSELRKELGNSITKASPTAKDQAKKALYDSIKDSLDTVSPEIRALNLKQKQIFDLAEEISRNAKFDNPLRAEIPFIRPVGFRTAGLGVDLPLKTGTAKTVFPRIKAGVYGLTGAENPAGVIQRVGQPAMAQMSSMFATGDVPKDQVDIEDLDMEFENQQMGASQSAQFAQQPTTRQPQPAMRQPQQQGMFGGASKQELLQAAAKEGASLNDLNQISAYYDMLNPQQGGLDSVQRAVSSGMSKQQLLQNAIANGADLAQVKELASAYDLLVPEEEEAGGFESISPKLDELLSMHSDLPATGFVGGRTAGISKAFGNVPTAAYESASSSLAVELAAAMGLKPLSEAEVAEVRKKWLPSPTDTPAQARAKIASLKTLLSVGKKIDLLNTDPENLDSGDL